MTNTTSGKRNEVEIRFFGMRRSGNHAAIYWLAHHFDEPVWFANDLASFPSPEIVREQQEYMIQIDMYEPECVRCPLEADGDFWQMPKKALFHSYEDKFIGNIRYDDNKAVVGTSGQEWDVLVIRDPFNLFASRMARGNLVIFPLNEKAVTIWKQHAREALGDTNHLRNRVVVSFNQWVMNRYHRIEIERAMGLSRNDSGFHQVSGVGSSFDGKPKHASEMDVFNRWRAFAERPGFRSLFDEEVWFLSQRLFGHIKGTEVFRP